MLLLAALVAWFHSLKLLPLVQAVAVGYTAPIFISLLAMLVLSERPGRWIWAALALGVLGCAVSLWPELSAQTDAGSAARVEGPLAALVSAVCYAGVVVLARHQAQRDALWTILLVQNLLPVLLLAGPAALGWQPMSAADLGPVLLIGLLATGGLVCITWAFTHVEASRAAPLEYTGLVWAAGLGWLLFGELPTVWSLGSAALIVGWRAAAAAALSGARYAAPRPISASAVLPDLPLEDLARGRARQRLRRHARRWRGSSKRARCVARNWRSSSRSSASLA